MIKKIYKPKKDINTISNRFVHYWTNDGENFPDVADIETYLTTNYGDNYEWVAVPNLRLEENKLDVFKIEMGIDEIYANKTIFIKLEDETGKEIPRYFYATNINQFSDENYNYEDVNNNHQSYSVVCELDCWATFGCKMNDLLKKDECKEKFLFLRKMCNRYFKLTDTSPNYWLDYLLQPYLMQTGKFFYGLVRDKTEEFLSLSKWRVMNGFTEDIESSWRTNGYTMSSINTYVSKSAPSQSAVIKDPIEGWLQNCRVITNLTTFADDDFNSNGKYRYLTLKVGSNDWPAEGKEFNGCIKTKNVVCRYKNGDKTENKEISINGETLLMIPFKKYEKENDYLRVLNDTHTGLIVANGSLLGMCINDIPPDILASALRKYNTKTTQTIGDKLSLHEATIDNNKRTCPVDVSALELYAQDKNGSTFTYSNGSGWCKLTQIKEGELYLGDVLDINEQDKYNFINGYFYSCKIPDNRSAAVSPTVPRLRYTRLSETVPIYKEVLWEISFQGHDGQTGYLQYKCDNPDLIGPQYRENWHYLATTSDILSTNELPLPTAPQGSWVGVVGEDWNTLLHHTNIGSSYIPTIVHDFSYIPVTIEQKTETGEIAGGSVFFKRFLEMLSDTSKVKTNTKENEPLLYSPSFWQWIYYIDGLHKIILTPDMLDFDKLINNIWEMNLNVTMTSSTNFKLDLNYNGKDSTGKIISLKNIWYPFTKSTTELISYDPISFPSTTEAFNNWYQGNALTQETSKNAKDIDIKWARTSWGWQQPGNIIQTIGGGAGAGAFGGPIGVAAGALAGGLASVIGIFTSGIGLQNKIRQVNEQWENDWRGTLGNMYSAPTSLNPSGFATGSLIYSPTSQDVNNYQLFKTFTITPQAKREVWNDISTNGYYYKSQCLYKDYVNRKKFNIVNANFDGKDFYVDTYLRDKMMPSTMIFSQQMFIDWFKMKSKSKMRLFREDFSADNFDKMVEENIEISYKLPDDIDK